MGHSGWAAAKPRVSDDVVAETIRKHTPPGIEAFFHTSGDLAYCLALDLRDARNEIARLNGQTRYDASAEEAARWRECAAELADGCRAATHDINDYNCEEWPIGNPCSGCEGDDKRKAALARFDTLRKKADNAAR